MASEFGTAYHDGGPVKLPVRVSCLDPLGHICGVQVETWAGVFVA